MTEAITVEISFYESDGLFEELEGDDLALARLALSHVEAQNSYILTASHTECG